MRVLGIDPSLTSLGVAVGGTDGYTAEAFRSKKRGMQRIVEIREYVKGRIYDTSPDLVVYEGYAFGFRGKSNTLFDLGELGGILKFLILGQGLDILLAPPNCLKMFVTGSGKADKEAIAKSLQSSLGVSYKTSDEYDALGLVLMGEGFINARTMPRDRRHHKRRAIAGCSLLRANEIDFKSSL